MYDDLKYAFEKEAERWFADSGDEVYRLNYELNENSVVLDIGGYEGKWSELIYNKYNCNVHIFEPVKDFYNNIIYRFGGNKKISVYNFGVGGDNVEANIALKQDSSSIHKIDQNTQKIIIKKASDILSSFYFIDLIKINIEGAEYDLLDEIIKSKSTLKIKNIQVQFHIFINDCCVRREAIRKELSKTHELTYNYDFVWENWRLKS